MAWKDTLLDASFRGIAFETVNTTRSGQRAIAVHEYPYTAGADLEDLNIGPRRVRVQAVFYGDDYEIRLAELVDALEAPGAAHLVHPIHGNMLVLAESWDDEHEAEFEGATVSISFVEHQTRDVVFSGAAASSKIDAVSSGAATARAAADDALADHVSKVPASAWQRITVFKNVFNQAKTQLRTLLSITSTAKVVLSDLDPILYPRAYAADLLSVIDVALQGLPFGGRNLLYRGNSTASGSGQQDFDTVRRTLSPGDVSLAPAVAVPSADMLADAAVTQAHARVYAATAIAECTAIIVAGELEETLLDRADIEAISNQTRSGLQVAITSAQAALDDVDRTAVSQALRDLAWQVQEAARAVVNQRPPLVRRTAPIGGPVRLVAHAIYGDGGRAPEIVRLNRLGRNVLVAAGDVLNVYAS